MLTIEHSDDEDVKDLSVVPSFSTGATFLDAHAQAHHKPLSAFGDLVDNAGESGATALRILHESNPDNSRLTITLTDNGRGMSEYQLRVGIGGIGHSDKAHRAEDHFGVGAKSALPRLSPNSLVFSKSGSMRTVALISTTLSRKLGSYELKVPLVTWGADDRVLTETADDAPLALEQRQRSLQLLLKHTPFGTERMLLEQFACITSPTGTRCVLFDCNPSQFVTSAADICIAREGEGGEDVVSPPAHEESLRAYLEVLWYADDSVQPTMQVYLCGHHVLPRNWSTFLLEWPAGRPPYSYEPRFLAEANKADEKQSYGAMVRFGTTAPLDEIIEVLSRHRSTPEQRRRKQALQEYTGVFYYNHGRMTMALEKLPKQVELSQGNSMQTTEKKINNHGIAIVGVCREGFLTPEHNKAGYEAKTYQPNVFARPGRPSFQDLHKVQVNNFLKKHLKEVIGPAYAAAKQRCHARLRGAATPQLVATDPRSWAAWATAATEHAKRSVALMSSAAGSSPSSSVGTISLGAQGGGCPTQVVHAAISASSQGQQQQRKKPRKAAAEEAAAPAEPFEEGARYRLVADPCKVGAGVMVGFGWYCLRLGSGHTTANVRHGDLQWVGFERAQLPTGYELASAQLDGTYANVTFTVKRGSNLPFMCQLYQATDGSGAVMAQFDDGDVQLLFIAVQPSTGACVAFDRGGIELHVNPAAHDLPNSIFIAPASIKSAANALCPSTALFRDGVAASAADMGMPAFLQRARLESYADALLEQGWDDVAFLRMMSSDALSTVADDVGMKPGHKARFIWHLAQGVPPST